MINIQKQRKPTNISVLIPDGGNLDTLKILRCLGQAHEIKAHILSRCYLSPARFSRHCSHYHHFNVQSDKQRIDVITETIKRWKIDVVLPATLPGMEFISRNQDIISKFAAIVPLAEPDQLKMANDKWKLYCFAKQKGLPVVPTILFPNGANTGTKSYNLENITYPAVLKPTNKKGGIGIAGVNSPSELNDVWKSKAIIRPSKYILQSYIPGIDFSLSVLCKSGRIIAYTLWKALLGSENTFGLARVVEYTDDEKIVNVGRQLVSALNWSGVADIDLILDARDHKIKIIEINPRFWQTLPGSLISGINFPYICCLSALGITPPKCQHKTTKYASPSTFLNLLKTRLAGKKPPIKLSWRDTNWRFIISDPLPELVNSLFKAPVLKTFSPIRDRLQNQLKPPGKIIP